MAEAGWYVLERVHARGLGVGERGVVGPIVLVVVGHFVHVWHGVTVTQLWKSQRELRVKPDWLLIEEVSQ